MADYPANYYEKLAQKLAVIKKKTMLRQIKKSIEYIETNGSGTVPSADTVKQS